MPTIKLTPTACTVESGWHDLRYFLNDDDLRQVIFTYPNNATLGGPGINITNISIKGYARNASTATKRLIIGFKDSTAVATGAWSQIDSANVVDGVFTAVTGSNGNWKYANITRMYSASGNATVFGLFSKHIQTQFSSGNPIYMGIIQPDRSKSININASLNYWTIEVTYELLGNVPSASVNTAVIGSTPITTTLNKVIPSSSTTIRYKIGDTVLSTKDIGAGVTDVYIPPTSAGNYFPNTLDATLTVEAETFVGGESYGTVSTSVTLTLPSDTSPTATCTPSRTWVSGVDTSAQIAAYVQTKSGVSFALDGSAKYGATVASYRVVIENNTYSRTSAGSVTHSPIAGSGIVSYTYTITDSRGISNTYTNSINVLAWSAPKITRFTITRVTEDNTEAIDGTYAKTSVAGSVSDLTVDGAQENSITYYVRYREIGGDTWVNSDTTPLDTIIANQSSMLKRAGAPVGTFNDMMGYEFQLVFSDIYAASTSGTEMPTKETYWDVDEETGSMGFGGEAMSSGTTPRYDFYGPVYFRAGVAGGMVYSNNEVDTGNNWIDGRPIYRRVLSIPSLTTGATGLVSLGYSVAQIDTIISARGFALGPSNNWLKPIPMSDINSAMYSILCDLDVSDQDDMQVRVGCGSSLALPNGGFVIVEYTKSDDNPTYYYLPFLASNNDKGCVASCSSIYTASNQAFGAFNGALDSWWASAGDDTDRWVQVQMPYSLRNMIVTLVDRADVSADNRRANTAGAFLGSSTGTAWTELFSFTDRNPNFENSFATTYHLNNTTPYKYLRYAPAQGSYSSGFASSVAEIRIEGEVV